MSQFTKPDFLKAGPVMTDPTSRIDTDILEPVVQSETFCRFQFTNKGILNAGSRITFCLNSPETESFLPLSVGIGSLIERVSFKSGGKTICEVQDWGHLHAYESVFMDQSAIKEREQFLSGRALSMGLSYDDGKANQSSHITLDNGKEKVVNATSTSTNHSLYDFMKLNSEPVFSLRLDDLVPCLRGQELPLFKIMEDVQLEITFTTPKKRVSIASGGDDTKPFTINTAETRLIADYTFLDVDEMDAYMKDRGNNYGYTFMEPRLTKTTLATSSDWENQIRNVGGAGRVVSRAVVSITSENITASGPIKSVLCDYRSIAPQSSAKGVYGKLTSNFKKNDRFLYPIDRSNSALHYHGVQDATGSVPHIARSMYARQGYSIADNKFEGHAIGGTHQDQLLGQQFYTAYRFNDGERVDSRGLELHSKLSSMTDGEKPFTSRCWIMVQKVMTIQDGKVDVMFS